MHQLVVHDKRSVNTALTVLLVVVKLVKMAVSGGRPVDVRPVCKAGESRAWKSRERMQCEAVAEQAYNDLATNQCVVALLLFCRHSPSSPSQRMLEESWLPQCLATKARRRSPRRAVHRLGSFHYLC